MLFDVEGRAAMDRAYAAGEESAYINGISDEPPPPPPQAQPAPVAAATPPPQAAPVAADTGPGFWSRLGSSLSSVGGNIATAGRDVVDFAASAKVTLPQHAANSGPVSVQTSGTPAAMPWPWIAGGLIALAGALLLSRK